MAVISSQTDSVMVLEVQTGLTPAGGPILSSRSISVKGAATDQDIFDVGTAMQALSDYPLISVRRENHFDLAE
ncbi:MAG: DUF1659 domain-containing protein [Desulfosporosinus sp.]|nr:DUF1659 domain-containing protein [Desulfosporosinus sp.]